MPLPTPHKGESQDDFMGRCMGNETMKADFPENNQRLAVCFSQFRKKRNNEMIVLEAEIGKTRTERFNGRDHLVVPIVGLVEGVLQASNSPAPELANGAEIAKSVPGWNGRPIVLDHPEKNGMKVSANSPDVLETQSFGMLFNSRFEDKKLKFEAWVDTAKAEEIGGHIAETVKDLENGKVREVSTGMFLDVRPSFGTFEGKEFFGIWENIVPDHLAIMSEGKKGACSVEGGCGTNRLNEGCSCEEVTGAALSKARRPSFSGTEKTSWAGVSKTLSAYISGYEKSSGKKVEESDVAKLPSTVKNWIASKTLLGDGSASSTSDLIVFPVVNPNTNKLNEGALRAVLGGRGAQAKVSTEALASARNVARSLLNSQFDANIKASEGRFAAFYDRFKEFLGLGESMRSRMQAIQAALDSSGSFEFVFDISDDGTEAIIETRNGLVRRKFDISDNGAVKLADESVPVRARTEFVDMKSAEEGKGDMNEKEKRVNSLIENPRTRFAEENREFLMGLEEDHLKLLEPPEETKEEKEKRAAEEKAAAEVKAAEEKKKTEEKKEEPKAAAAKEPVTLEQYVKDAPPEVRTVIQAGLRAHQTHVDELIRQIKANSKNKFSDDQLKGMDVEVLESLAALATPDDYSGQGGPRTLESAGDDYYAPAPPDCFAPAKSEKTAA